MNVAFVCRRWCLVSCLLTVALSTGCCAVRCGRSTCGECGAGGCWDGEQVCEPCPDCGTCDPCGDGCRPRFGARLAGRWHDLQVAASTPRPELPPHTGLHPVPTAPVFGDRLSGREAGLLASGESAIPASAPPAGAPRMLPVPESMTPMRDATRGSSEHINRLPQHPIRRVSHVSAGSTTVATRSASELRFKR